jgi:CheY-like chemotaxis protein
VSDTGVGMAEAVREHAFEPFFTTKALGRGTGLGLSTVYGFVKQSRGAIRLDSTPGAGTRLTLVLPLFVDVAPPVSAAVEEPASLPRGLKVLLVEDEPEVRSVVRGFLRSLGCAVTEFANGEQAIAGLAATGAHDLLLSDVALGAGMRGSELARRVRSLAPDTALLLMSGYSMEMLGDDGQHDVAAELLRKPFDREQLAAAIARATARRR